MPTAELWANIRAAAEAQNVPLTGVTVQGVSQLRSLATAIQGKAGQFEGYTDSKILRRAMFAQAPWSRSLAEQSAMPRLTVRFQHTFERNGEEVTEWRTSMFDGQLPRTVGDLRDLVEQDAINMADKYGVEHIDISDLQLFAV